MSNETLEKAVAAGTQVSTGFGSTTGGTGIFSFNWSNTNSNSALNGNLSPGNYTCQLVDANQCTVPQQNATITMVSTAVISNVSMVSNPTCNGSTNGLKSINAKAGKLRLTSSCMSC